MKKSKTNSDIIFQENDITGTINTGFIKKLVNIFIKLPKNLKRFLFITTSIITLSLLVIAISTCYYTLARKTCILSVEEYNSKTKIDEFKKEVDDYKRLTELENLKEKNTDAKEKLEKYNSEIENLKKVLSNVKYENSTNLNTRHISNVNDDIAVFSDIDNNKNVLKNYAEGSAKINFHLGGQYESLSMTIVPLLIANSECDYKLTIYLDNKEFFIIYKNDKIKNLYLKLEKIEDIRFEFVYVNNTQNEKAGFLVDSMIFNLKPTLVDIIGDLFSNNNFKEPSISKKHTPSYGDLKEDFEDNDKYMITETSTENIDRPTENIDMPTENIDMPTENIDMPTENIDMPTENIDMPTENIDIPTESIDKATENIKTILYYPLISDNVYRQEITNITIPSYCKCIFSFIPKSKQVYEQWAISRFDNTFYTFLFGDEEIESSTLYVPEGGIEVGTGERFSESSYIYSDVSEAIIITRENPIILRYIRVHARD